MPTTETASRYRQASQIYTVDIYAPVITSVTPDPQNIIPIGSSPTFAIQYVEVGNTAIAASGVNLWLTTNSGNAVTGTTLTVNIDGNSLGGSASLATTSLAAGSYILHGEVSDVAGNRTSRTWTYQVGANGPVPGEAGEVFNYPNPFTPEQGETRFAGLVKFGTADAKIKIYDFAGQFVATVWDGPVSAGQEPVWKGRTDDGTEVANGVYLAHVVVKGGERTVEQIVKVAFKKAK